VVRWAPSSGKTLEGSIAFLGSVLVSTMFLWAFGGVKSFNVSFCRFCQRKHADIPACAVCHGNDPDGAP
jgi:dolichol kinase